jgi:hypothetical protein
VIGQRALCHSHKSTRHVVMEWDRLLFIVRTRPCINDKYNQNLRIQISNTIRATLRCSFFFIHRHHRHGSSINSYYTRPPVSLFFISFSPLLSAACCCYDSTGQSSPRPLRRSGSSGPRPSSSSGQSFPRSPRHNVRIYHRRIWLVESLPSQSWSSGQGQCCPPRRQFQTWRREMPLP